MNISIIEQSCISKYQDEDHCEDGLYIGPHYLAVVDGVTSKGSMTWPGGRTGGRFARDILLAAMDRLPADAGAAEAVTFLNSCLAQSYGDRRDLLADRREERPQAAVIIYSFFQGEIWSFGDCQCIIDGRFYSHSKMIDDLLAEVRCFYNHSELLSGKTKEELMEHDAGRSFILPLMQRQLAFAGGEGPYAYDILDGFDIRAERTVIHKVSKGSQVVIASDGYPKLMDTLEQSEEFLARVLKEDPLCIDLCHGTKGLAKGNRSFDDRTYMRFMVQ